MVRRVSALFERAAMRTLYHLLGVDASADDETIRRAFRTAAKAYHPDLNAGDLDAEQRFKQIIAAYAILKNPERRSTYDRQLQLRRQRLRQELRITIAGCIASALVSAGLVGGGALLLPRWLAHNQTASVGTRSVDEVTTGSVHRGPAPDNGHARPVARSFGQDGTADSPIPTGARGSVAPAKSSPPVEASEKARAEDPLAMWAVLQHNPPAGESALVRSSLEQLIDTSEDMGLLQRLRSVTTGAIAGRVQQRIDLLIRTAVEKATEAAQQSAQLGAAESRGAAVPLASLREVNPDDAGDGRTTQASGPAPGPNRAVGVRAEPVPDAAGRALPTHDERQDRAADPRIATTLIPFPGTSSGMGIDPISPLRLLHEGEATPQGRETVALGFAEPNSTRDKTDHALLSLDRGPTGDRGRRGRDKLHPDRLLADYDQAIRVGLNDAAFYSERGRRSYASGDLDKAIADFNQAIRLDPANPRVYSDRGNVWDDKGKPDLALADYDQAIRIDPDNAAAFHNRGIMWRRRGALDRALADFDRAIHSDVTTADFYADRGLIWYDRGQYDRAIADFDRAVKVDPGLASAFNNRGNAYDDMGDPVRALADYNQALRLNPRLTLAYVNRGILWRRKAEFDRAIADFDQALRIDPDNPSAHNNRGLARSGQHDFEGAILDFTRAIELGPNDAPAYTNRGWAYHQIGREREALADADKAIEHDPKHASAFNCRAQVYEKLGDRDKAIADFRRAAELDPNLADPPSALRRLGAAR